MLCNNTSASNGARENSNFPLARLIAHGMEEIFLGGGGNRFIELELGRGDVLCVLDGWIGKCTKIYLHTAMKLSFTFLLGSSFLEPIVGIVCVFLYKKYI